MNCKTARKVWNHKDGFIAGIIEHLPGVLERLESQVEAYVTGETNPYNDAVKDQAVSGNYYAEHAMTENDPIAIWIHDVVGDVAGKLQLENYFSNRFNQPIFLGNMCCGSCITHDGTLTDEEILKIQIASVNTEPDGSRF